MYIADVLNETDTPTCGDSREIYVTALGNHTFAINDSGPLNTGNLIGRLDGILQYRDKKVLFLRAEPGASYSDFIEMTDAVYHRDISITLMTHRVEAFERNGGCIVLRGYPRNSKPDRLPGAPALPPALK